MIGVIYQDKKPPVRAVFFVCGFLLPCPSPQAVPRHPFINEGEFAIWNQCVIPGMFCHSRGMSFPASEAREGNGVLIVIASEAQQSS